MDTGQVMIEDTILAACELWLGSAVNHGKVLKMLSEAFKPNEAKDALDKLKADDLIDNVLKHHQGDKYFEDIVKAVAKLIRENKMPKVVVTSLEVFQIPRPDNDDLDNVVVGARMDVMEKEMESMDKNVTELLRNLKKDDGNQATQKNALPAVPTPGAHGQQAAQSASGVNAPQGYAQAVALGNGSNGPRQFRQSAHLKK